MADPSAALLRQGQHVRPVSDKVDVLIRQKLREGVSPEVLIADFEDMVAFNATALGFVQRADGTWYFLAERFWGLGVHHARNIPYDRIFPGFRRPA